MFWGLTPADRSGATWSFVGSTTARKDADPKTVSLPAGLQVGDFLVLVFGTATAGEIATPDFWTPLAVGTPAGHVLQVFTKIYNGIETSVTLQNGQSAGTSSIAVLAYRGFTQLAGYGAINSYGIVGPTFDTLAFDTTGPTSLAIFIWSSNTNAVDLTIPGGYTSRVSMTDEGASRNPLEIADKEYSGYTNVPAVTATGSAAAPTETFAFSIRATDTGYGAPELIEYLVVAGGGSGGCYTSGAGGGGAGGMLTGTMKAQGALGVRVGAGGNASATEGVRGNAGGNSQLGTIVTIGGGGGATGVQNASSGGSGGGGSTGGAGAFGSGTAGQGNSGADGIGATSGAGGGGAGSTPTSIATNDGGPGGIGLSSSITGTSVVYAAGGGGAGTASNGTGGSSGVGGKGGNDASPATAGATNTGSGGGGTIDSTGANGMSGAGAAGVVIIRYPSVYAAPKSITGTYTDVSYSGWRCYKWTAGTGSITF